MSEYQGYSGPSADQIARAVRQELESGLNVINNNIIETQNQVIDAQNHVERRINTVDNKLQEIEDELLSFVREQRMANRLGQAETRIGTIRQKLEKEFGHYDKIRRALIGILEATDLALVRQNTITTASEELFLYTPHYWLAPCLVALAAWINNNEDLAKRAIKEALKRNAENTSLFFALVTRRAERFQPSLLWVQHYLAMQNEEDLNRNALIILEALVCGIWGNDTEGVVSAQFKTWIDKLESRSNFYEDQVAHWKTALLNKRKTGEHLSSYILLYKFSPDWNKIDDVLNGVELHETVNRYVHDIFDQKVTFPDFKTLLDESLTRLVTDYDDEELPLREEEQLESLVIKFRGNEKKAQAQMDSEKELFAVRKNFLQLLLEAAMHPEAHDVNIAVTKFAVAVSKYYIYDAYNDIATTNRSNLPEKINLVLPTQSLSIPNVNSPCNVSEFKTDIKTGKEEREILQAFNEQFEIDKNNALQAAEKYYLDNLPTFGKIFSKWFTVTLIVALLLTLIAGIIGFIIILILGIIIGAIASKISVDNKKAEAENIYKTKTVPAINDKYEEMKTNMETVIRGYCAEVVDFYEEFKDKDAKATEFLDYIETLEGNEYIHVQPTKKRVLS